jgi:hypothetical protein
LPEKKSNTVDLELETTVFFFIPTAVFLRLEAKKIKTGNTFHTKFTSNLEKKQILTT